MSSLIALAAAQAHLDDLRRQAARHRAGQRDAVLQSLIRRPDREARRA